ncbi:unnamed protein product [Rhodiola kirilowii]
MLGFIKKGVFNKSFIDRQSSNTIFKFEAFLSSTAIVESTHISGDLKGDAFTASYLLNSCGITVTAAKRMSARLPNMKSTDKPERVLKFFRSYGFDDTQISRIVRRKPLLLLADPDKSLKPKFEVFTSIGASHDRIVEIISKCPGILTRSVENGLVPMFDLLKSSMGSNEGILEIISKCPDILTRSVENGLVPMFDLLKSSIGSNEGILIFLARNGSFCLASVNTLGANVVILREMGMLDSALAKLIKSNACTLMVAPDRFKSIVDRALAMGFDMGKFNFGDALRSFMAITEDNWKKKAEIYRKWGWSESEFLTAFKKQPRIMLVSEKKIEGIMNCLVYEMGVEPSDIARLPYVLLYSLENRIVPRCSVIQLRVSKGLIEIKDCNVLVALMISEEQFLELYVKKHKEILTELMEIYSTKAAGQVTSNAK